MNNNKHISIVFCFVLGIIFSLNTPIYAQSSGNTTGQGCANVEIRELKGTDTLIFTADQLNNGLDLSCDNPSVTLVPIGFAPGHPDPDKGYYTYEKIAYDPPQNFNKGSKINLPKDDCWSALFGFDFYFPPKENSDTPGFKFFFYDKSYNTVMANSNGGIHFFDAQSPLLAYAQQNSINLYATPSTSNYLHCPYATSQPFPDNRDKWNSEVNPTLNSINGPFMDIHYGQATGNQGMYIDFIGQYPCRMCILSFYDIPLFGNYNSDTSRITSMIVLYETTNVIEFYMKRKPAYTSTNGSNSVLGIQNIDGTAATTITNNEYKVKNMTSAKKQSYNNTIWEATEEAWRIKPTDELIHNYTWYKKNSAGPQKDMMIVVPQNTNNQIIAQPGVSEGDTWYYCKMSVTRDEDGKEFAVWDSVLVHPLDVPALVISHNSADNPATVAMNIDSTFRHDTICAGDRVIFRFQGGDEYEFIAPEALAGQQVNDGTITVNQDSSVDEVFYKFAIRNYKNGVLSCTRYDSCYIYNRKVNVNIGNDTSICQGKPFTYKEQLEENKGTYIWTFSKNQNSIGDKQSVEFVPQETGTLTLKLTDNRGCSGEDKAIVNVVSYPIVTIEGEKEICEKSSTVLFAKSNIDEVTYLWDNGKQTDSIKVAPTDNTDYQVTVTTKQAQCSTTENTTVKVYNIPVIKCYDDVQICEGEHALVGVNGEAEKYLWTANDVSVNEGTLTEYSVSPEITTQYEVAAYNNARLKCKSTASMTVFVEQRQSPIMSFSPEYIDELTPIVTFTDNTTGIVDRIWNISDGSTSSDKNFRHTFTIEDSITTYYVTLTSITGFGCVDSVTTPISVVRQHHIWAPTGIYIHSNNANDGKFSLFIDAVEDINIKVFNRWGTVVFETNDINEAWDCKYKGNFVEQGVYTWYASYRHKDNPNRIMQKSGTFMIYN